MWPSCGREHLVRRDVRVLVAQPRRVLAGRQVVHALVGQPRDMGVQHADVDLLPLPGQVAMPQRRQDADAAIQPGEQVGHRHADLLRQPVGLAGQAHDAAHRLDQAVVARPRRIRPGLAEAGDRAVDQPRKPGMQLLVAQAVFRQRADLEVLHQDVAAGDQLQRDLLAFRLADIQRDRLLVAVDADEIGAFLVPGIDRRREAARVVAGARPLDLDHVGAQVGQHLRAGRPCQHTGQVENAQALQGTRRLGPGRFGHIASPRCRLILPAVPR